MGSDYAYIPLHRSLLGRDMRRLPYRGRSILLECDAVNQEMGTINILGDGVVDSRWELDRDNEYKFWRSTVDLVWVDGYALEEQPD